MYISINKLKHICKKKKPCKGENYWGTAHSRYVLASQA